MCRVLSELAIIRVRTPIEERRNSPGKQCYHDTLQYILVLPAFASTLTSALQNSDTLEQDPTVGIKPI